LQRVGKVDNVVVYIMIAAYALLGTIAIYLGVLACSLQECICSAPNE
jgi:hypothetical protein